MNDKTTGTPETRTDLAWQSLRLAKERTFAAVVRTALALIGFGIAVAKLLPNLQPAWVAQTIGILLVVGGAITALMGFRVTLNVIETMHEAGINEPRWFVILVTLILLVTATLALLIVGLY
jgi:putative membrane protein